jgi:Ca2+/H+ antiporter
VRTGARYALSLAAALLLGLLAFPWILRVAAPLAEAWSEAAGAVVRAFFRSP